jgi:hypothetical protein
MKKYKKDSNFVGDCRTELYHPIHWTAEKFHYEWLELWHHAGSVKTGIVKIKKEHNLYWRGIQEGIYGVVVVQTGKNSDVEWIRVLRKTPQSIIVNFKKCKLPQ